MERRARRPSREDLAGIIPCRVRVGVTGHRVISDLPDLVERVDWAIHRIRHLVPGTMRTPVLLEAVSPLGEGADRLVSRRVLEDQTAVLEAPLPLGLETYRQDFTTEASKAEFSSLLGRASTRWALPGTTSREESYRQVGDYVVDSSDVLIALWDGRAARGVGGTAEIVARARKQGKPLVWIRTEAPHEVTEERTDGTWPVFDAIDRYNQERAPGAAAHAAGLERRWMEAAGAAGLDPEGMRPFVEWIAPYHARADLLSGLHRARFVRVSAILSVLAVIAVAVVAGQVVLAPERPGWVWIEFALMALVAAIWGLRHRRVRPLWIKYRFLAERFRSAIFLAVLGLEVSHGDRREGIDLEDESRRWLKRAFREVWRRRPVAPTLPFRGLKRFTIDGWIRDQQRYYRARSERHRRAHRAIDWTNVGLFATALTVAGIHASDVVGGAGGEVAVLLAIVLPAVAAALGGFGARAEHVRNHERFGAMADRLEAIAERMEGAPDRETLSSLALEAAQEMLIETSDWIDVMRFHDLELPV